MYAVSQSFWFTIEQWGTRSSDEQSRLPPLASNGWIMSLETPKGLTVRLKPDWSTASEASAPSLRFKKSTKSHPQHLAALSMLLFFALKLRRQSRWTPNVEKEKSPSPKPISEAKTSSEEPLPLMFSLDFTSLNLTLIIF